MFDEAWRYVDAFKVRQAAALWSDEEPLESQFSKYPESVRARINAATQMLCGDILTGELKADHSTNGFSSIGQYGDSTVTRDELIRYARQKDLLPAFLFDTIAPEKGDRIANDQRPPKNKGGRPPEYDWDKMWAEIVRVADMDGLPTHAGCIGRTPIDLVQQRDDEFALRAHRIGGPIAQFD